jgi:hypothetical protein
MMRLAIVVFFILLLASGEAHACFQPLTSVEYQEKQNLFRWSQWGFVGLNVILALSLSRWFWLSALATLPASEWVMLPTLCSADITVLQSAIYTANAAFIGLIAMMAILACITRRRFMIVQHHQDKQTSMNRRQSVF